MKRRVTFTFVVGIALVAACDVLAPPPPVVPAPVPGFVLSRPFPNIRTLNDVAVLGFDEEGITSAYAVGTDGAVLAYNGISWLDESPGLPETLESVSGVLDAEGNETVLAVGANGVVLQRVAGEWSLLVSPVTTQLFGVWVRSNNDAFVVGDRGTVLRWNGTTLSALIDEVQIDTGTVDDAGNPVEFAISDPLKSVMGQGENDVWTVGPRGVVYHYDGTRFRRDDSQTNRPLADVFTRAGIWAAATDGVLLRRRDEGWVDNCEGTARENCPFLAPAPVFLQGIWARNDSDVFAVGLSENLFHFEDGQWSLSFVEEQSELRSIDGAELPRAVDAADDAPTLREVIAVGAGGRIVRGPLALPHAGETHLDTRAAVVPEGSIMTKSKLARSQRLLTTLLLLACGALLAATPAVAAKGKKTPATKATPKTSTVKPDSAAPDPRTASPAVDPDAPVDTGTRKGPARIEFDDRLVQGQTNKANAIYLFERRESALRTLLKKRTDFHDEIDEMLEDELVR